MAENLIDTGPPNAKRPKMTAPASDGPGNGKLNLLTLAHNEEKWIFLLSHTMSCTSDPAGVSGISCFLTLAAFMAVKAPCLLSTDPEA